MDQRAKGPGGCGLCSGSSSPTLQKACGTEGQRHAKLPSVPCPLVGTVHYAQSRVSSAPAEAHYLLPMDHRPCPRAGAGGTREPTLGIEAVQGWSGGGLPGGEGAEVTAGKGSTEGGGRHEPPRSAWVWSRAELGEGRSPWEPWVPGLGQPPRWGLVGAGGLGLQPGCLRAALGGLRGLRVRDGTGHFLTQQQAGKSGTQTDLASVGGSLGAPRARKLCIGCRPRASSQGPSWSGSVRSWALRSRRYGLPHLLPRLWPHLHLASGLLAPGLFSWPIPLRPSATTRPSLPSSGWLVPGVPLGLGFLRRETGHGAGCLAREGPSEGRGWDCMPTSTGLSPHS
uniref:Uncharacterized protein LOC112817722 n=1 Tax=Callorhinus ursinus TaxID=34884 RepID=A0A3Q7NIU0_CALUR|nr:uncharacterized protein LOC112817722 [Callorhinus ursinus]XP_025720749.1 uncharacterized protein LOC112817722 [Callorhinus ursinus]